MKKNLYLQCKEYITNSLALTEITIEEFRIDFWVFDTPGITHGKKIFQGGRGYEIDLGKNDFDTKLFSYDFGSDLCFFHCSARLAPCLFHDMTRAER